jgi:hypothetical protein
MPFVTCANAVAKNSLFVQACLKITFKAYIVPVTIKHVFSLFIQNIYWPEIGLFYI